MDQIQQLADYIEQSHSMVAITGAGISLAGGGITYSQLFSKTILRGIFGRNSFLRSYVKAMHNYKPTFSHYVLRDLETAGKLIGVITTNEDCMHTMAGSKNVAEIQGGFQINRCSKQGEPRPRRVASHTSYGIFHSKLRWRAMAWPTSRFTA
ncbi:MAG: hypothetical protein LUG99_19090 [Lachnospiraceae bacterium]|nr:hypothetical protein [Lachnospiraceae bacterium]